MCFETLDDLLHERNGILRTSDALARGITKSQFYEYVNSAKLEKAAQTADTGVTVRGLHFVVRLF